MPSARQHIHVLAVLLSACVLCLHSGCPHLFLSGVFARSTSPPTFMCSGPPVFFLVRVPSPPFVTTSADALARTHSVHATVSPLLHSPSCELRPVLSLILLNSYSAACRVLPAHVDVQTWSAVDATVTDIACLLVHLRPTGMRQGTSPLSADRGFLRFLCTIRSNPGCCISVSFCLHFAHEFCVGRMFG